MIQRAAAGTLFETDIKPLSLREVESLIKRLRAARRRSLRTAAVQYAQVPGGGCLAVQVDIREALERSMGGRG